MAQVVKKMPVNAGDVRKAGSIPGLGRSPGGGNGNPLQYSSWNISSLWDIPCCWVLVYMLRPETSAEGGALLKPEAPLFLCLFSSPLSSQQNLLNSTSPNSVPSVLKPGEMAASCENSSKQKDHLFC